MIAVATVVAPPTSFEQTYRDYFKFVWRVLARLGVPERDLPDAVQDVFLVVYRKHDAFDGRSRITTWLYGICFRIASERRRSARSRLEVLENSPGSERASSDGDERAAGLAHQRRLLTLALDSMPLDQRAVFAFFELDGMSGDEIAEQIGVSVATVHSRLRLARQVFRRVISRVEAQENSGPARSYLDRSGGAS